MNLIKAAIEDSRADVEEWSRSLWSGSNPDVSPMAERVRALLVAGFLSGVADLELEEDVRQYRHALRYQFDWEIRGSPNVGREFKQLVNALKSKSPTLGVLSPKFLSQRLGQTAWFISGITSGDVLERLRREMIKVRSSGGTLQDFLESASRISDLTAARMENVYRTNVASAAGAGRWKQVNDPEVSGLFHGYRYQSRDDDRARPLHRLVDGFAAVRDDPIWSVIWVPNGYQCRCKVRPLRLHQAASIGLTDGDGNVLRRRVFANPEQRKIVEMAESNSRVVVDGRWTGFPDPGFRGNYLIDLVA